MQRSHCLPLNILLLVSFTFYSALYWSTKRNHPFVLASFEIECDPSQYYGITHWFFEGIIVPSKFWRLLLWSWFSTINRSCGSLSCRQWDPVSSGLIWLNVNQGISIFSLSQWSNHVWSLSLLVATVLRPACSWSDYSSGQTLKYIPKFVDCGPLNLLIFFSLLQCRIS